MTRAIEPRAGTLVKPFGPHLQNIGLSKHDRRRLRGTNCTFGRKKGHTWHAPRSLSANSGLEGWPRARRAYVPESKKSADRGPGCHVAPAGRAPCGGGRQLSQHASRGFGTWQGLVARVL